MIKLRGYRTYIFNGVTLLVGVAGIGLQYVGQLGLTDVQAGYSGLGLALAVNVGNFYLRSITTTAPGKNQ